MEIRIVIAGHRRRVWKTFCSCGHNNTMESSRCEHVLLVIKGLGLPKEDLLIRSVATVQLPQLLASTAH